MEGKAGSMSDGHETLNALVVEWQRTRDPRIAGEVYKRVERLIHKLALASPNCRHLADDLAGEAALALYRAMDAYRPNRGKFASYFRRKAASRLGYYAHHDGRDAAMVPRLPDAALEEVPDERPSILDALADREEFLTAREIVERIRHEFKPRMWHVLEGRLLHGKTYAELGAEIGKTKQAAAYLGRVAIETVADRVGAAIGRKLTPAKGVMVGVFG